MSSRVRIQAFFSYAHHDAKADPDLINIFTGTLATRVSAKLTNVEFSIWQDVKGIRLGETWNNSIEDAIMGSQVFILLLSPKWIESEYCRREYDTFKNNVEDKSSLGNYVAPLMIRDTENQKKHFSNDQMLTYRSVRDRQYTRVLASDLLKMHSDQRLQIVDILADDVVGMVERFRSLSTSEISKQSASQIRTRGLKLEFDARAHSFEQVDLISGAEVIVDASHQDEPRAVFAQISFIPRMYIQSPNARVEFGVRRALLRLDDAGQNSVRKHEGWSEKGGASPRTYYVTSLENPHEITICIDAESAAFGLGELSLPPAKGENRLASIGYASPDLDVSELRAKVVVKLDVEGIHIFSKEESFLISGATTKKIASILEIAVKKGIANREGILERDVPVSERKR